MKTCLKIVFILTILSTISCADDGLVSLINVTLTHEKSYKLDLIKDDIL